MTRNPLLHEDVTGAIIASFREVYNTLEHGLLEYLYVRALEFELRARGRAVGREVTVPVYYKEFELGVQRLDMIVDGCVVVEAKSTSLISPGAARQLYNYLRVTRLEVGMLLHFGPERPAFRRIICQYRKTGRPDRPSDWEDARNVQDRPR